MTNGSDIPSLPGSEDVFGHLAANYVLDNSEELFDETEKMKSTEAPIIVITQFTVLDLFDIGSISFDILL